MPGSTAERDPYGIYFIRTQNGFEIYCVSKVDQSIVKLDVPDLQQVTDKGNITTNTIQSGENENGNEVRGTLSNYQVGLFSTTKESTVFTLHSLEDRRPEWGHPNIYKFPTDFFSEEAIIIRTINGVYADPETGNVEVDTNKKRALVIATVNGCYASGWENNTCFIYRTGEVCINASINDDGKELTIANDFGSAINVSVNSTAFYKLKTSGDIENTGYTSFPTGFKGRFRVVNGAFLEC